ncbi:fasciclin domain-containing protein [Mycobacterium sp. B14F4]|uniref:fasciclin domain-containing protein n=1 Tax=Mycobacterium sp. B14F4 TaxID=3153565 RepID=UPI00325DAB99
MAVATLLVLSTASASADPVAEPIGPSCAVYVPEGQAGAGSMAGVAQQPPSMAVANNPKLSALSAALSGKLNPAVNMVDTLNAGQVTIFAPVDNAFSRLPPEVTAAMQTNAAWLTRLLTYHVIPGRFSPTDINGTHTTLQGGELSVTGPADRLWVNDALVLCGGIISANATLYLIDTVLMPPPAW